MPDNTADFLRKNANLFRPDMIPKALDAVRLIKSSSELKDLWEEGKASGWNEVMLDLERRLKLPLLSKD